MAHGQITIPVAGELRSVATEGRVASAEGIYDYNLQKSQEQINRELSQSADTSALANRVSQTETALQTVQSTQGTQGSQISGISQSVSTLQGTQSTQGGQISQLQQDVQGIKNNPANKPTINKTWAEMIQLKNSNGFIPGQSYRITDYATAGNVTSDIDGFTNHSFDIIVTALTENTLDEDARAAKHAGDTYFSRCNLEAWRLKYILDPVNDYRFASNLDMISSQTKGWIYYMEDDHLNSANYDFKNILVRGTKVTDYKYKTTITTAGETINHVYLKYIMSNLVNDQAEHTWEAIFDDLYTMNDNDTKLFYTFSYLNEDGTVVDASATGVYQETDANGDAVNKWVFPEYNRMSECSFGERASDWGYMTIVRPQTNLFLCDWEYTAAHGLGLPCHNTFGQRTFCNTFGNFFVDNTFYNWSNNNVFENYCVGNIFNYNAAEVCFGLYSTHNLCLGAVLRIRGGNYIRYNVMRDVRGLSTGDYFTYNTIGKMENVTVGRRCIQNKFPENVLNTTIGEEFTGNEGSNYISYSEIGDSCKFNDFDTVNHLTMGNSCSQNQFHSQIETIVMGNNCSSNIFEGNNYQIRMGDYCSGNYFEKVTYKINFGESSTDLKGYYKCIHVGSYNDHINLNCTGTLSGESMFYGIILDNRLHSPVISGGADVDSAYITISNNEVNQQYTTKYTSEASKTITL